MVGYRKTSGFGQWDTGHNLFNMGEGRQEMLVRMTDSEDSFRSC